MKVIQVRFFNPGFWLARLLVFRWGTPHFLRAFLYRVLSALIWLRYGRAMRQVPSVAAKEVTGLKKNGFTFLPSLTKAKAKSIRQEIETFEPKILHTVDGRVRKHVYANADLLACQGVVNLAMRPDIVKLVSDYLGHPPVIQYLAAWQTFALDVDEPEMNFHMDHHGHKFLKLFVYLDDVSLGDGQHEYICGTHYWSSFKQSDPFKKFAKLRTQVLAKRRYQGHFTINDAVIERYLAPNIIRCEGVAGTTFIEDTSGLHRGTPLTKASSRMILQVLYTPMDSRKDNCIDSNDVKYMDKLIAESTLPKAVAKRLLSLVFSKTS